MCDARWCRATGIPGPLSGPSDGLLPSDLVEALQHAPAYVRCGPAVRAARIDAARTWTTERGSTLSAASGDWLVTGVDGRVWSIDDGSFKATYRWLEGDRYVPRGRVRALQLGRAVVVPTREGPARAEPGDWLVADARGASWPIGDDWFRTHYRAAED